MQRHRMMMLLKRDGDHQLEQCEAAAIVSHGNAPAGVLRPSALR